MLEAPDILDGAAKLAWRAIRGKNLGTRSIFDYYLLNFSNVQMIN